MLSLLLSIGLLVLVGCGASDTGLPENQVQTTQPNESPQPIDPPPVSTPPGVPDPVPQPQPVPPPIVPPVLPVPVGTPPVVVPPIPVTIPPAPVPEPPIPIVLLTWAIEGILADGGTIIGTLTYDCEAVPLAVDVRGLTPNKTYPLVSYTFTVQQQSVQPYTVTYPAAVGELQELCLGLCIFSPNPIERVYFSNGRQSIQLSFLLPPMPFVGVPLLPVQWGALDPTASWIRSQDSTGAFQYLILVRSATLTLLPS